MKENPELDLAYEFVQYTNRNIFLTGKAGTGKTTFLKSLKDRSQKRMVVVAPTGVAAINAGGQTIHSFFQLPFGPIVTERVAGHKISNPGFEQKFAKKKINIIKSLDLLVIDEISMVRADVLDAIDEVLRRYKNRNLPFGGIQLLMIGDLQQLAPVVKDDEWSLLRAYYESMYFFNSKALKENELISLELKHVYRQGAGAFLNILNEIRDDRLTQKSFDKLHERYIPDFSPSKEDGYITLTTHNNSAQKINTVHLDQLKIKSKRFTAQVKGNFSEHSYPTSYELELKVGAQVMFVKNDSSMEKRYFNGKIGVITAFEDESIVVRCDGDVDDIYACQEVWENVKYSIDDKTKEIQEEVVGSYTQFPLRLAWAITIHKSQGLTFDHAIIDAAAAFAHGQTYVALSRCRTMEGLVLTTKISNQAIICDQEVSSFNQLVEANQPDKKVLEDAKHAFQLDLLQDLFQFKSLFYIFQRLEKVLWEHQKSIQGNLRDAVELINKTPLPEIHQVAQNFLFQVKDILKENPDAEQNSFLQERLKKASSYFYTFQETFFLKPLKEATFETDNKESKKSTQDLIKSVYEQLEIKQACFDLCQKGFVVKDLLEVRAKAAIEENTKTKKPKTPFKEVDTVHPELYTMLKYWRQEESEMRLIPLYQVASNKLLQGVANALPTTEKQLLKVRGVGKRTLAEFGDMMMELVRDYMVEHNIEIEEEEKEEPKAPKLKSHEKSFQLYLGGKEIQEIAKLLSLVPTTIEGHLARYVAKGKLDLDEFVEDKLADKILDYIDENPKAKMSEVKYHFGDVVSWSEIRFIQSHLEFMQSS